MKRLIITGDDFGLAVPVNEAIETAHQQGILSSASLMVGECAVDDAVERARHLPNLKVGLHIALVEGRPVLPPDRIPDLVDPHGDFYGDLTAAGFRFFFRAAVRRQLEAEIRAQFEAFGRTGLPLDHVNTHNHMHLHPTVLTCILRVGRDFGLNAVRLPYEPLRISWHTSPHTRLDAIVDTLRLGPWSRLLRMRLRRAGIKSNDRVFGLRDSGRMDEQSVLRIVEALPEGITEIYFHPATRRCREIDRHMADYRHEDELAALTSPNVRTAVERLGIRLTTFGDLADGS